MRFNDEVPIGVFKDDITCPKKFNDYRNYLSGTIDSQIDNYRGEYEVKPRFFDNKLDTSNKFLREDITVKAIEVSRTSNPQGGITVYVGGTLDA